MLGTVRGPVLGTYGTNVLNLGQFLGTVRKQTWGTPGDSVIHLGHLIRNKF